MRYALVLVVLASLVHPASADEAKVAELNNQAMAAYARGDFETCERLMSLAIIEEPGEPNVAVLYGNRGVVRFRLGRNVNALEDMGRAVDIYLRSTIRDPAACHDWMAARCLILAHLCRWPEARDAAAELLRTFPDDIDGRLLRARAGGYLGQVDTGIQEISALVPRAAGYASYLSDLQILKGDLAGVIATAQTPGVGSPNSEQMLLNRVQAECELGKMDEARAHVAEFDRREYTPAKQLALAYFASTPGHAGYDFEIAMRAVSDVESKADLVLAFAFHGRLLFLAERYGECREYLSTHGSRSSFECLYWLGAAQWKLDKLEEARATLVDARRLNPYLSVWARRIPGFEAFVAQIDTAISTEKVGDAVGPLSYELATHPVSVAEIETLVRRYQFGRAVAEYERLLTTLTSSVRKAEVAARLDEVKGLNGALTKLVAAINAKSGSVKVKVGKTDLSLTRADERSFDFSLVGGQGKSPWAYVAPLDFCKLAGGRALAPTERFALGVLLWDIGEGGEGQKLLGELSGKDLKSRVDAVVSRKRGVPVPAGGFVAWKGRFVTPEEKTNLEKGLVRFQGRWVTPEDRARLAKGMIFASGKWVTGDTKKLVAAGYRQYKDQWMSAEDYDALRAQWANAFEQETEHFKIRTNVSEGFAKDLAAVVEVGYGELKRFYDGREPTRGAEKMTLFAFRTYEDYRRHCVEHKAEAELNAAGFASSDSMVVVGWNKTGNLAHLLQTMVHEAAHLYFFRICNATAIPSWHAEGMATYFEGFKGAGASWKFDFISETRLAFAREAMRAKRHIPLAEVLTSDALTLINSDAVKANLFYSQCWAINYFLSQTDNAAYRDAYKAYRTAVEGGSADLLSKYIPDLAKLERDWIVFITSQ